MDDQIEYWKDKIDYISVCVINSNIVIHFLRPSIPDKVYKNVDNCTIIRLILSARSEKMIYNAHDFTETYYGINSEIYNLIFDKYLKGA